MKPILLISNFFITQFLFSQIDERWIVYGSFEDDQGNAVIARFKIEHRFTPWRISLAQYGLKPDVFDDVQISSDTSQISFTWKKRTYQNTRLNRIHIGKNPWESIWAG
ncbi:MAG: hypothetical protein KDD94_04635, partial [Calditrichaeota bacterium]|nr:hypothetical protein [Calditrichota bacterium]